MSNEEKILEVLAKLTAKVDKQGEQLTYLTERVDEIDTRSLRSSVLLETEVARDVRLVYEGQEMMIRAVAWNQYPKEQVKEMLLYHTLKGEWSYHNISTDTKWYETMGNGKYTYTDNNGNTVEGDTAKISMVVRMVREAPIQLNNWSWNYRGVLSETTGSIRSSNLKATNGYIHVLDYYLERPTRAFLEEN